MQLWHFGDENDFFPNIAILERLEVKPKTENISSYLDPVE